MIRIYTQVAQGQQWLTRHRGQPPLLACVLGFTETALIPGISAAGATPADRQYTCLADAEFLANGPQPAPVYPLPPLIAGASPVLISRGILEHFSIPLFLFNAGLTHQPSVSTIDLGGVPAQCLTTGEALPRQTVEHLWQQGLAWGEKLATEADGGYLILAECVVGGTTTALGVLTGLGVNAVGKVNSSHPQCNHGQKISLVQQGLAAAQWLEPQSGVSPLDLVAAVGDPMQITVAGMAIAASHRCGVLLAGGTQMLAVYALMEALVKTYHLTWKPEEIVIGTTRWVAEDPTGDTVGLAQAIGGVPLLATQLSFANSRYPQLKVYEQGFVKEGVGAGGCAIASHLTWNCDQTQLLHLIESLVSRYAAIS